jgi:hypothetical protein
VLGWRAINSSAASGMTAAVWRLQVSRHELHAMAPSPVAEATGLTGRCPPVLGREHPGHAGLERQRRTLGRPAGRRLADPVQVAAGRPGNLARPPPPRLSTFPRPRLSTVVQQAEQRLCSNPPQAYAQLVILTAQKAANRHKWARAEGESL